MNDKNNLDFVSIGTGGHNTLHTHKDVKIQSQPEDSPPVAGLAKASPKFKEVEKTESELTDEEKKKVIANNIVSKPTQK